LSLRHRHGRPRIPPRPQKTDRRDASSAPQCARETPAAGTDGRQPCRTACPTSPPTRRPTRARPDCTLSRCRRPRQDGADVGVGKHSERRVAGVPRRPRRRSTWPGVRGVAEAVWQARSGAPGPQAFRVPRAPRSVTSAPATATTPVEAWHGRPTRPCGPGARPGRARRVVADHTGVSASPTAARNCSSPTFCMASKAGPVAAIARA
jgi:hypothetical protein